MLKWGRANECPWDLRRCATAAKGGHLEILKWRKASDCPWDVAAMKQATINGHTKVEQWCRVNGCAWPEDGSDFDDEAQGGVIWYM